MRRASRKMGFAPPRLRCAGMQVPYLNPPGRTAGAKGEKRLGDALKPIRDEVTAFRWFQHPTLPADLVGPLTLVLPPKVILDGELLVWDTGRGRCSFSLLQSRLTAGRRLATVADQHPAHLVAFDLLRDGRGTELLDQPLGVRRAKLQRLLRAAPPQVVLCPQTQDHAVALGWLADFGVAGIEAKQTDERYRVGSRAWTKVRARETAEYVVGGVTGSVQRPATLLLGRFDGTGVLRYRVNASHPGGAPA